MDLRIDVTKDLDRVTRSLELFAERQIPFATAQALNALGKKVKEAERGGIIEEFPTATPFTVNSVGQAKARKDRLETVIYVRDIAAAYLDPYLSGGVHHLNSRALLNPKNIPLNQYGNIPRNKIANLKGRQDTFIGTVQTKAGKVSGVWQRIRANEKKGTKESLKLLVRFGDALPVKQRLPWGSVAQNIVHSRFDAEFGKAMARAIATARLK